MWHPALVPAPGAGMSMGGGCLEERSDARGTFVSRTPRAHSGVRCEKQPNGDYACSAGPEHRREE